jgi:hypothetical protein
MPSTSKAQQRLMAQAYSLKKGVTEPGDIDPEYRKEIEDLARKQAMSRSVDN